jgi:hypothetical protein
MTSTLGPTRLCFRTDPIDLLLHVVRPDGRSAAAADNDRATLTPALTVRLAAPVIGWDTLQAVATAAVLSTLHLDSHVDEI